MPFQEPQRIHQVLQNYPGQWAIAGGWAIDLFLNRETRIHGDIEICIPRNEQGQLQAFLAGWKFRHYHQGKASPWQSQEYLELPIHEIHGNDDQGNKIEILLNEIEEGQWKFRRNLEVIYPNQHFIQISDLGIPMLAPEIVLLYKSKGSREKDTADLRMTLPALNSGQRIWLKTAIQMSSQNVAWMAEIDRYLS